MKKQIVVLLTLVLLPPFCFGATRSGALESKRTKLEDTISSQDSLLLSEIIALIDTVQQIQPEVRAVELTKQLDHLIDSLLEVSQSMHKKYTSPEKRKKLLTALVHVFKQKRSQRRS